MIAKTEKYTALTLGSECLLTLLKNLSLSYNGLLREGQEWRENSCKVTIQNMGNPPKNLHEGVPLPEIYMCLYMFSQILKRLTHNTGGWCCCTNTSCNLRSIHCR